MRLVGPRSASESQFQTPRRGAGRKRGTRPRDVCAMASGEEVRVSVRPAQSLFTAWCTSTRDHLDHAVTDEAIAEDPAEPRALCGTRVEWGPMELPPSSRRHACADQIPDAVEAGPASVRLQAGTPEPLSVRALHPIRGIRVTFCRVLADTGSTPVAPSMTAATRTGDRPKPPAVPRPGAAGAPAGEETQPCTLVSSPALETPHPQHQRRLQGRHATSGVAR